VQKYKFILKCS